MYLRISKEDKKKLVSLGIEAQRSACLQKAQERGWPTPHEYCDMDVSGRRAPERRPAMARLLAAMRAGEIDVVIIAALDRLSRKIIYTITLREEMRSLGVELVSCRESFIANTPIGNLMVNQMASYAQFEGEIIGERVHNALEEKRRIAGRPSGRLPYGYIWRDTLIEINQGRAATVRDIFRQRVHGSSMQTIATDLNTRAIPAPYGSEWRPSTIHVIIRNREVYHGKRGLPSIFTTNKQ